MLGIMLLVDRSLGLFSFLIIRLLPRSPNVNALLRLKMIAAHIDVDLIVELRYKLRCFGLPVERHSDLIGDNFYVVVNTTLPLSKIKNKHLACSNMRVREAIAAGFVKFGHIRSELNIDDIATKPLGPHAFHQVAHLYLFRHLATYKDNQPTDNADIPLYLLHTDIILNPVQRKSIQAQIRVTKDYHSLLIVISNTL